MKRVFKQAFMRKTMFHVSSPDSSGQAMRQIKNKNDRMKNLIMILATLLCLIATSSNATISQYTISGTTMSLLNGKKIMLFKFYDERVSHVDTALIVNGTFSFSGLADTARFAIISCGNYPDTVRSAKLILESGEITVSLSKHSTIGGTPLNNIYEAYLSKVAIVDDSLEAESNRKGLDSLSQIAHNKHCGALKQSLISLEKSFIKDNSSNLLGITLLRAKCIEYSETDFFDVYNASGDLIRNDAYIKRFAEWYVYQKQKKDERERKRQELEGKPYTDFTFLSTSGQKTKLSSTIDKTKYVLVVFWASWCSPCLAEQPIIKDIYESYKSKGLEVIGISLDEKETAWKEAIKRIGSTWIQLRDTKGGNSGIKDIYGFTAIPYAFIIDRDGKIVALGIPGVILKQYISRLLK